MIPAVCAVLKVFVPFTTRLSNVASFSVRQKWGVMTQSCCVLGCIQFLLRKMTNGWAGRDMARLVGTQEELIGSPKGNDCEFDQDYWYRHSTSDGRHVHSNVALCTRQRLPITLYLISLVRAGIQHPLWRIHSSQGPLELLGC